MQKRNRFWLHGLAGILICALAAGCAPLRQPHVQRSTNPEALPEWLQPVKQNKGGPTGSGILYVTDKIPSFKLPSPTGRYYPALVPDTMDLAECAGLGVHGMTSCTDPGSDYEIYGSGFYQAGRLKLWHTYHDYNGGQGKWIEALPLLRNVSGSRENLPVDGQMMETMFHMLGSDGLYWIPKRGASWQGLPDPYAGDAATRQVFNSWPAGRALMALAAWHQSCPDPAYRKAIENMVDGLAKVAVYKDNFCYFHEKRFDDRVQVEPMPLSGHTTVRESTILAGLAYAYKVTRYEPARVLAEKLARYYMVPSQAFEADGRVRDGVHFHGATLGLLGLLVLGQSTDNQQMVQFVNVAYASLRPKGIMELGWFPEILRTNHSAIEICQVADMAILAAELSAAGQGDWWEDVEYLTRNLLRSAQIRDTGAMEHYAQEKFPAGEDRETSLTTFNHVPERIVGTFESFVVANGRNGAHFPMHCCTGNGNRAFWYAWHRAVDDQGGILRVNLLQNRAARAADVDSYLPYEGKVVIRMKAARRLQVRIPSWVSGADAVTCQVNGRERKCRIEGRYLDVGQVGRGKTVMVRFPLARRTLKLMPPDNVCVLPYDKPMSVDLKGFDIVEIWPKDHDSFSPMNRKGNYPNVIDEPIPPRGWTECDRSVLHAY